MRLIIAGSRDFTDRAFIERCVLEHFNLDAVTEVVSGGARGVDAIGEQIARERGIKIARFLPDWDSFKRRAGPIRNTQMAHYADALIAFPRGESRGTRDMIRKARKQGLRVIVVKERAGAEMLEELKRLVGPIDIEQFERDQGRGEEE